MDPLEQVRVALESFQRSIANNESKETFADAVRSHFAERAHRWKASTREKYDLTAKDLIAQIGAIRLSEITRQHGIELVRTAPHPSVARSRLTMATAVWRCAQRREVTPRPVPWAGVKPPAVGQRDRWLPDSELEALATAIAVEETRDRPQRRGVLRCIRLLILTGCRIGEIATLRVSEIDYASKCLRLRDSKTGPRNVPIGDRVLAYLRAQNLKGPWVCPTVDGRPVARRFVRHVLLQLCKQAGIEPCSPHALRHTWITQALIAGEDIEHIRRVVGHSTVYMTSRYGHLTQKHVQQTADRVSDRLGKLLK